MPALDPAMTPLRWEVEIERERVTCETHSTYLEVDVQHGLPVALAVDAGVVDDDVDAAEGVQAEVEDVLHAVCRRDVDPPVSHVLLAVFEPQILSCLFPSLGNSDVIGYSHTLGNGQKCHCKQLLL